MNQTGVVPRWYDLGVQLLNRCHLHLLDEIQANYQKVFVHAVLKCLIHGCGQDLMPAGISFVMH